MNSKIARKFSMIEVRVPCANDNFLRFGTDLAALPEVEEVHFDFSTVSFATPGWMISIGGALRQFREDRSTVRRKAINYKKLTYPAHAGFFQFFGMKFGNELNTANSSERFIPITPLLVEEIKDEAIEQMEHHGDTIQRSSEELIGVLLQSRDTPAFQGLAYAMREMIRNVVEHSASPDLAYAAQYWPGTGKAEIAITDRGMGLAKSLSSNPKIGSIDDEQALDLAVQAGVSSKTWRKQRSQSVWANSGYGLYMVKGLCVASGGALSIASGSLARTWSRRGTTETDVNVAGTTVILQLNSHNLKDINLELRKLRDQASSGKPSTASMSLNPSKD
jgi:hypothetical protein